MDARLFGRRLKAVRQSAGFDDAASFADLLHVDAERYRSFEDGSFASEDLNLMEDICRLTGRSLDFLVRGRDPAT